MKTFNTFLSQISESLVGDKIAAKAWLGDHLIQETVDGYVFVDRILTEFTSLEEAKMHLKQRQLEEDIHTKIQQEQYQEMSHNKIADVIRSHHENVRITDTLIESYVELASSKLFTLDPVVRDIARANTLDRIIEGRMHFILNDGSTVVITEETFERINNVFGKHPDVIEYMRSGKDNFLGVIGALEE